MITKHNYKKLVWIDVEAPTKEEVLSLMDEYRLPELVAEELVTETYRSKVDLYNNLIYMILHFPTVGRQGRKAEEQEIDFVLGKDFLITVHYGLIDPLHTFSKLFEVNSILDKQVVGDHAGYLFYYIIRELYKQSALELEDLNGTLRDIEHNIFAGREGEMVENISNTNRKLLDFKQAIRFHHEILKSFETAGKDFFGESFGYYLSSITGEYTKVRNILDSQKEILNDLRTTNDSLLSTKTNETIKTLTIITFIMLPLTLITGVFGMNSDIVFIHSLHDFLIVLGAMSVTALVMFIYFKHKRWL